MAIDAAGNVWVANADGGQQRDRVDLRQRGQVKPRRRHAGNFLGGADFNNPYGVAIDAAGNVWVANDNGNSVTELTSSGGLAGNFAPSGANFSSPFGVAIDAAGNVWVTNKTTTA